MIIEDFMSKTRGGEKQKVFFNWGITNDNKYIVIVNLKGSGRWYKIDDISDVLNSLKQAFNENWFPLANNVEKLANGTEKDGLGYQLYHQDRSRKNRTAYAQGASYLGVVLEEVGILKLNNELGGSIQWKLRKDCNLNKVSIRSDIKEFIAKRKDLLKSSSSLT